MKRDFAELLATARVEGWRTADDIGDATGCGRQCGLCAPYIAYAMKHGKNVAPWPLPEEEACARRG